MAKTFEVEIKFEDREKGPGTLAGKAIVTAGSMAAASTGHQNTSPMPTSTRCSAVRAQGCSSAYW